MVRLFLQLIEKMDQPRNVPPTELPQNIESSPQPPTHPPPPTPPPPPKFQKTFPPLPYPVRNPGSLSLKRTGRKL